MAHVEIAGDNRPDRRIAAEHDTVKNSRPDTPTRLPSGPALSGEGLELLRSSLC